MGIGSNFATANPNTWAAAEIMGATAGNYNLLFHSDDTIIFEGAFGTNTSAIEFKDVSAWYNIVPVHDTSASTSSARF